MWIRRVFLLLAALSLTVALTDSVLLTRANNQLAVSTIEGVWANAAQETLTICEDLPAATQELAELGSDGISFCSQTTGYLVQGGDRGKEVGTPSRTLGCGGCNVGPSVMRITLTRSTSQATEYGWVELAPSAEFAPYELPFELQLADQPPGLYRGRTQLAHTGSIDSSTTLVLDGVTYTKTTATPNCQ